MRPSPTIRLRAYPALCAAMLLAAVGLRRPELVAGRHVVLVDDILTTGATLSECARCLEDAAPRIVGVLAVARVV